MDTQDVADRQDVLSKGKIPAVSFPPRRTRVTGTNLGAEKSTGNKHTKDEGPTEGAKDEARSTAQAAMTTGWGIGNGGLGDSIPEERDLDLGWGYPIPQEVGMKHLHHQREWWRHMLALGAGAHQ